jgi:hypothetical protein
MLVNFFIAGAQKGGTTALDRYLRQHRKIQMAAVKEIHFFDDESLDWRDADYTRLHQAFRNDAAGCLRGEATPIYTYWPASLERIKRYNRDAKFIVALRHPSFRAYSHWKMEVGRGCDTKTFCEAIDWETRDRVRAAPHGVHRVYSYVERGFYSEQIERILRLFPRKQVMFFRTDRLWSDLNHVLDQIQDFLEVDRELNIKRSYIVPGCNIGANKMPLEARHSLDQLFADDIRRTAKRVNINLDDWLDVAYEEPMRPD